MSKENKSKSKKVLKTQFSYNPLWKMLIDRGLKKRELQEMSEVSATSIAKLGRNENVTTEALAGLIMIIALTVIMGGLYSLTKTVTKPERDNSGTIIFACVFIVIFGLLFAWLG